MNNLRSGLLLIAIALGSNPVTPSPSWATDVTFRCAIRGGVPTTVAQTPQVEVAVVLWNSPDIAIAPGTTQQAECEAGSQRFQTYHDNGDLPYITTGTMEGHLVACVAAAAVAGRGGGCRGRLFALAPTNSPRTVLQRILRIRLPTEGPMGQANPSAYVNLMRYIEGEYNTAGD